MSSSHQRPSFFEAAVPDSKSSVLLQFLKKCQAAEVGLSLSVLPQDQQVIRGARDQPVLLEAHKHLTEMQKGRSQQSFIRRAGTS